MSLSPPVPTLRTDKDLADLKQAWLADPCWDLEDAVGYEAHKHELTAFRLRHEAEVWGQIHLNAACLGVTAEGLALIRDLQRRVERLEGVVQP